MARTQTISQSYALLAGPSPATGVHGSNLRQVWALQSLQWSQSNPKQPVTIYGKGAPIGRETVESPQVNLSFSYLITNAVNEVNVLEFDNSGVSQAMGPILSGNNKNFFVFKAPEGSDAIGLSGASSNIYIYGLGNCFLTSYSLEASVGNFPTASVQYQGVNMEGYTGGVSQTVPAVDSDGVQVNELFTIPTIEDMTTGAGVTGGIQAKTVIKPGDISIDLSDCGGIFEDYNNPCVQSFRMNFDLNRNAINCLGTKFATSRTIQFPIDVNLEVEMLCRDSTTGSLAQYLCQTGDYSAEMRMRLPTCDGSDGYQVFGVKLLGLSFEEQSWNPSLGGDPSTITTRWVGQIGGVNDDTRGFFMSGEPD